MSNLEQRRDQQLAARDPRSTSTANDLLLRSATELTPFQAYRVGQKLARRRMETVQALAAIEDETSLAEARKVAQARVQSLTEQAERLLHAERTDCLVQAALKHEEGSRIIDLLRDEQVHSLFKDALHQTSSGYITGVARRSGSSWRNRNDQS